MNTRNCRCLSLGSRRVRGLVMFVVVSLVVATTPFAASLSAASSPIVQGAGRTIIEAGSGGTTPTPITTTVAFHATNHGGNFECLALIPAVASGPGSGDFSVNAMYVTGIVTSLHVHGDSAILQGTATVTGLGAGTNLPFEAQVVAGGPGTTIVLRVSDLTFHEILLEGHVNVR